MKKLFDLVFKLVRLVLAQVHQPWAVVANGWIIIHRLFNHRVVNTVEFKAEKDEVGAGVGHLFLNVAIELGAFRIGCIARINKTGIGDDLADQFIQRLEFLNGFSKVATFGLCRFVSQIAFPAIGKQHG